MGPFAAGAGVDPATHKYFVSALVVASVLLWSARVVMGLFSQWRAGNIEFFGLVAGTVRSIILAMLILYFIQ